jgi:hypothetical protein
MCQSKITAATCFTHTVFKSHQVVSNTNEIATFTSSGTTGINTSKHLVTDRPFTKKAIEKVFLSFMET